VYAGQKESRVYGEGLKTYRAGGRSGCVGVAAGVPVALGSGLVDLI
jgi:hypothetical protein